MFTDEDDGEAEMIKLLFKPLKLFYLLHIRIVALNPIFTAGAVREAFGPGF